MVALPKPANTTSTLCSPLSTLWLSTLSKNVIRTCQKILFRKFFGGKCCRKPSKLCMIIFSSYKWLIWTLITNSMINLFAVAIFLYIKLCSMHRVYCLNFILNEWEVKLKNTHFSIQYCNTMNFKTSEYESPDIFKLTANYWNSQCGTCLSKQYLPHG